MFVCPVCGSTSYSNVLSEIFKCDGCSVLFNNPQKFSGNKGKKSTEITSEQLNLHTESLGGIVSKPIKLNRG